VVLFRCTGGGDWLVGLFVGYRKSVMGYWRLGNGCGDRGCHGCRPLHCPLPRSIASIASDANTRSITSRKARFFQDGLGRWHDRVVVGSSQGNLAFSRFLAAVHLQSAVYHPADRGIESGDSAVYFREGRSAWGEDCITKSLQPTPGSRILIRFAGCVFRPGVAEFCRSAKFARL
jgi:hypothetical protein